MQDNVITLAVDELNDGNTVDYDFNRFDVFQNRSIYHGEDHDVTSRDTMTFYRTPAKTSGNYRGNQKSAIKLSKDRIVDAIDGVSQLTAPEIYEVSFSIPVGVDAADRKIMRQRLIALLDDDAFMESLVDELSI